MPFPHTIGFHNSFRNWKVGFLKCLLRTQLGLTIASENGKYTKPSLQKEEFCCWALQASLSVCLSLGCGSVLCLKSVGLVLYVRSSFCDLEGPSRKDSFNNNKGPKECAGEGRAVFISRLQEQFRERVRSK